MMDNITLTDLAKNCCASSRFKFAGVWSANNFSLPSLEMRNETVNTSSKDFQTLFLHSYFIINTSPVGAVGQHWLLLVILRPQVFLKRQLKTLFCIWDPLGKPIQNYTSFFEHLMTLFKKISTGEIFEINFPLQTSH